MQMVVIYNHLAPLGLAGVLLLEFREARDGFMRRNIFGDLKRLGSPGGLLGGATAALRGTKTQDGSSGNCDEGEFHENSSERSEDCIMR
jgi:hypothetical protein